MNQNHFFEEILIILAVALVTCVLFSRLRLPTIVAYMAAGTLIGPHVLGLIKDPDKFSLLAEFGGGVPVVFVGIGVLAFEDVEDSEAGLWCR